MDGHRSHGIHVAAAPTGYGAHRHRSHHLRGPAVDDPAGGLHTHLDLRRRRRDPRVRGGRDRPRSPRSCIHDRRWRAVGHRRFRANNLLSRLARPVRAAVGRHRLQNRLPAEPRLRSHSRHVRDRRLRNQPSRVLAHASVARLHRDERTTRTVVANAAALQQERLRRRPGEHRLDPQRSVSLRRRRVSRPGGVHRQGHREAGGRVAARSPLGGLQVRVRHPPQLLRRQERPGRLGARRVGHPGRARDETGS